MTTKTVTHFVTGGAAAGTLTYLIGAEGFAQVVELSDPLACGPLNDYGTTAGNTQRAEWFRGVCDRLGEPDLWTWLSGHIGLPVLQRHQNAPSDSNYIVWVGQSVDEQLMLRALCAALPNQQLLVADVTADKLGEETAPAVGACSVEELASIHPVPLSPRRQAELADEWHRITARGNLVRTWDGTTIIPHNETFFDNALLAVIGAGPRLAAEVIGQVLGEYAGQVGDTFLCYRLCILMQQGTVCSDHDGPLFYRQLSLVSNAT
ncbi:DUF3658 domain-containing protein [Photobacterium sp. MCCC 1A19761]|uniref:DUF3658 domain-containing protein n=1 Tax=Photobacterium sp. MCCC 1A19761 TaxID=3115000 RepID=UPI00307F4CED